MSRISQETIDRINDSADIVEVVSKSVELKKRGRNFFGLCPFHDEKTPSFSVAPDKGIYHCFGCGKGGNAVNFIIENEKLSFVEALQQLGQQLGIPVERSGGDESSSFFDNLYKIHESASALYHKTLFSERGERSQSIHFSKCGIAFLRISEVIGPGSIRIILIGVSRISILSVCVNPSKANFEAL